MALAAPQPLNDDHDLAAFSCGVASLDDWLKKRARANQTSGASRTFIVCDGGAVAGYFALASGGIASVDAPGRFRRNMPDPIPVAILGRLAVHQDHHGRGIGRAMFRDAALRVMQAAEALGIRGLLVHVISGEARDFYLALGLEPSPVDPMTLMVTMSDLRATFADAK